MINKQSSQRGYTIIELLAVVTILVIISSIVSGIIYSTLRGSKKTKIITEVAQNGQYAVSVISNTISDSRNVTRINGTEIENCISNPNSDSVLPNTPSDKPSITLQRLNGGLTRIACINVNSVPTVASNGVTLVNIANVTAISCKFSCSQIADDPYSIPIVSVSFTIKDKDSALPENQSSSIFNFSSSLRVYSP